MINMSSSLVCIIPGEYNVSATFNVSDFSPYDASDDSRSNPFEESGNVGSHGRLNLKDTLQVPDGPITRSRAKKIKDAMQGNWCNSLGLSLQIYRARPQHSRWA
jgi:hypothetical protein